MLTVLDEFTRQALAVIVRTTMGADDVLEVLYPLLLRHGTPEYIRSDNGPKFAADAMQDWLRRVGIKPIRIYPGSPLSADCSAIACRAVHGRTAAMSGLTGRCVERSSMQSGSRRLSRLRLSSTTGSGSTITPGRIRRSTCAHQFQKPY
jgi:hypothetical protein